MYNTDFPSRADLPTAARLKRSTAIAAGCAAILLVTVVMPAEYAIDPTGIGSAVGLTDMGKIKTQLAAEAAKDAPAATAAAAAPAAENGQQFERIEARLEQIERLLLDRDRVATALAPPSAAIVEQVRVPAQEPAQEPVPTEAAATPPEAGIVDTTASIPAGGREDEFAMTLAPGEGKEVKLIMSAGAEANFQWSANGSLVNFDTHGEGGGRTVSYEKGRGVGSDEGVLKAEFDGTHGWFWRNRTSEPVTLTLRTSGDYAEMKRPR
ncbi:hypothetical protein NE852_12990 [Rhizobium sp. Pop5]|uniref:hypothetical protein n=1 Tax=Rhizobium sp. Pop5 TaxID=1223565 RepID=UPI0002839003|nr:hypothetical protein [Rhizobium sp. Pop5]EJZ17368.1 hypothetical protein RCCGEPOP_31109 [Rhizobium sp. Pop5]UVD59042.1 hypothetical protein NE852_12990 [Rhizobium sp. Pop5]